MNHRGHVCGCFYTLRPENLWSYPRRIYLPQVDVSTHTTILSTTSRTTLRQTFVNPNDSKGIREIRYTFPLFDGVSVVGFKCEVKDRIIVGEVKEKEEARQDYKAAKERGETAGLLEQLPDASDVFTTTIGNVPPGAKVNVDITYLGELKHDAEVDGARFTIPTFIAPRYGSYPGTVSTPSPTLMKNGKFSATVDIMLEEGAFIKEVRSPSHPISVTNGVISTAAEADPSMNKASVTLGLGTAELDQDFVVQIVSKDFMKPSAVLESHPKYPNHKALMATLVPKFQLQLQRPEIVFICDRSGSMGGTPIEALKRAIQTFLKSLPVGVVFNICSFGSHYTFLWDKSQPYNQQNLDQASKHVSKMDADYGGTEMLAPVMATLDRRHHDRNLEVFLVTDGEIWDQQQLFDQLNDRIGKKKEPVRIFTLGIGNAVSSSLIEGVARAGQGFSQTVGEHEKMDSKVVRMLKGALLPHIKDYKLELNFEGSDKPENASAPVFVEVPAEEKPPEPGNVQRRIALFDEAANPDAPIGKTKEFADKIKLPVPQILQAPSEIPALFPFIRKTIYLLLPEMQGQLKSVTLSGTCEEGPLNLDIPVQILETPGQTVHQLAAKGAVQELEEGRGWIYSAVVGDKSEDKPKLLREKFPSVVSELARREAVRLGVQFQVGGKNCSFVAVEKKDDKDSNISTKEGKDISVEDQDYDFLDEDMDAMTLSDAAPQYEGAVSRSAYLGTPLGGSGAFKSAKKRSKGSNLLHGVSNIFRRSDAAAPAPRPAMSLMSAAAPPPPPGGAAFGTTATASYQSFSSNAPAPAQKPMSPKFSQPMGALASVALGGGSAMRFRAKEAKNEDECEDSESMDDGSASEPMAEKREQKTAVSDEDILRQLVDMQTFEGSWTWKDSLLKLIHVDPTSQAVKDALAKTSNKDALATALVIKFLEQKLVGEQDTWELMVDKARSWVEGKVGTEAEGLFETAEKIIV